MDNTKDVPGPSINIKRFDINTMCENPTIIVIGKRGSGKSWLCRYLLKNVINPRASIGVIFNPYEKHESFYSKCFPDLFIHEKFTSDVVDRILFRQKMMIEKAHTNSKSFVVMDDCLGEKHFREQPITELLFNARHYRLSYIMTMQFPIGISPELTCNFDYVFLFREDFLSNIELMYKYYGGMFPTFGSFKKIFCELTKDFRAMVIANRPNCNHVGDLTEQIFWFKAGDIGEGDFIGSNDLLDYHNKHHYDGIHADNDNMMFGSIANLNKMHDMGQCFGSKQDEDKDEDDNFEVRLLDTDTGTGTSTNINDFEDRDGFESDLYLSNNDVDNIDINTHSDTVS